VVEIFEIENVRWCLFVPNNHLVALSQNSKSFVVSLSATKLIIVVRLESCRTESVCVRVGVNACCQIPGALCLIIVVIFINDRLQQRRYANEIINVSCAIHHHCAGRRCVEKQAECVRARFSPQAKGRADNHYGRQAIYFYAPWPKYYSREWRRRCVSIWRKSAFATAFWIWALALTQTRQGAAFLPSASRSLSLLLFSPFFTRWLYLNFKSLWCCVCLQTFNEAKWNLPFSIRGGIKITRIRF
jgi:hypothetical protein